MYIIYAYVCVYTEPVKDCIISVKTPPSGKAIELSPSFSETPIYFILCSRIGQSPISHMAFVVGIPHPVTVKSS